MERLQQTSVQDNQSMQQSIQDLEVQMKEGKLFSQLKVSTLHIYINKKGEKGKT